MFVDTLFVAAGGTPVAKQAEPVEPAAPTRQVIARLANDARRAVRDQRAAGAAYDRSGLQLFALSVGSIAASAILGQLDLARSNVGLLSWVAIAVTLVAWAAGALAVQFYRLPPVEVMPTGAPIRRRELHEVERASAETALASNGPVLAEKRRWLFAFTQLVALQAAVIVAVELAARS